MTGEGQRNVPRRPLHFLHEELVVEDINHMAAMTTNATVSQNINVATVALLRETSHHKHGKGTIEHLSVGYLESTF